MADSHFFAGVGFPWLTMDRLAIRPGRFSLGSSVAPGKAVPIDPCVVRQQEGINIVGGAYDDHHVFAGESEGTEDIDTGLISECRSDGLVELMHGECRCVPEGLDIQ